MQKHETQDISEITKPTAVKIQHTDGNVKCSCPMQYDDVITNPIWRTDAILKIVLTIFRCHIGRSMRNLEHRWKITCPYTSRDKNCNFRKFKMADGHIISISQLRIIRFWSTLLSRCTFQLSWWRFFSKFWKFKMVDGRHIENRFLDIYRRHIDR